MSYDPLRRSLLQAGFGGALLVPLRGFAGTGPQADPVSELQALEREHGGRLGVCILDTGSGAATGLRMDERFPMCSTFKTLAAANVLLRVDRGAESLDRHIAYSAGDLVAYSPVTEKHIGEPGMSLAGLCHAAITVSDNTAGNLLLDSFGGPAALTAFMRGLGDGVTRLDRREPDLNESIPADPRDTTSPRAMATSLRTLLLDDALTVASRAQLVEWLVATTTGAKRIREGLPGGWRVGDKTGTSSNGVTNDVAIAWPPERAPLLVSVYYAESPQPQPVRNEVLAEVGRIAAKWVAA